MIKIKNKILKAIAITCVATSALPAFAEVDRFAALSSCKTIVGTTVSAGSGGVSDGSGGLKATSDLTIVSCVLPVNTVSPGVIVFLEDAVAPAFGSIFNGQAVSPSGTTACSLTSYDNYGKVRYSDSKFSTSVGKQGLEIGKLRAGYFNGYFGLACRLSKGDKLHSYQLYKEASPDGFERI